MFDKKILEELQEYIDDRLNRIEMTLYEALDYVHEDTQQSEIEDFIKNNTKPSFKQLLFGYIDKKGAIDSEIHKRAGIDRKHFSKIRSTPNYRPRKNTIIALALALELNVTNTEELLSTAGYSLSNSDTCDLIIQFCFEKEIYNIHDVNQTLNLFSQKPLTGMV